MKKDKRDIQREWEKVPPAMRSEEVKKYWLPLYQKRGSLTVKRILDVYGALLLLLLSAPVMLTAAAAVAVESPGGILFRQRRVTQYGRRFEILKFRTMRQEAGGALVTAAGEARITKTGRLLRRTKIDELPQLFNVLAGSMSLVGVRPEVEHFVDCYTPEMMATLLLPAGITSPASLAFRAEELLLKGEDDTERAYREKILPEKMVLNLAYIRAFSLKQDGRILLKTAAAAALEPVKKALRGRLYRS